MAYKFQPWELDTDGVPHCKKAGVFLEKDGVVKSFKIQEDVDAAWASGWHKRGKPETADVPESGKVLKDMTKAELVEEGKLDGIELDMSMKRDDMIGTIEDKFISDGPRRNDA